MIGIYTLTNVASLIIYDINPNKIKAKLSILDSTKQYLAKWYKLYFDNNGDVYFNFKGNRIYLYQCLKVEEGD